MSKPLYWSPVAGCQFPGAGNRGTGTSPVFCLWFLACSLSCITSSAQNKDPLATEIITTDINNFWIAFDAARPDFKPDPFQKLYIDKGTDGLRDFIKGRITSADYLAKVIRSHSKYYESIRANTDSIPGMADQIRSSLVKLKEIYPPAIFPPVYFVVGALSSGGTAQSAGLIIGAEMYGLTPITPREELNDWLNTVIKPVCDVPHIVAHELVHYQQKYDGGSLLAASIKEGGADFIAELISGKHINAHIHEFANAREKELWLEFKDRMLKKDYKGWLYSSTQGRPNDLGYWIGYQIVKSYYDHATDKKKAIDDFMRIRNFEDFLAQSKYPEKFY